LLCCCCSAAFERERHFDPGTERCASVVFVRHSRPCKWSPQKTTSAIAIGTQSGRIAIVTDRCKFTIGCLSAYYSYVCAYVLVHLASTVSALRKVECRFPRRKQMARSERTKDRSLLLSGASLPSIVQPQHTANRDATPPHRFSTEKRE
jgi:hypothetical protein